MPAVSMKSLLEAGVHFGHQSRKWNPKMEPYIFTKRNGIHIIDLQQTVVFLDEIYATVRNRVAQGGQVLYVGTKRQAQETIAAEAESVKMPYVNQRWLGGTLTNWKTIKQSLDRLKRLERDRDDGKFEELTKKERLLIERRIERLNLRLGGLRNMVRLPEFVFIVDVRREFTAVKEANTMKIPVIALVDTNCDPDDVDYLIPANDDAIRAIKLLANAITRAVQEGIDIGGKERFSEDGEGDADFAAYMDDSDYDDTDLLGESTLAKLRDNNLRFEDDTN